MAWLEEEEEVAGEGDRAVGPNGQWHKGERETSGRPGGSGFGLCGADWAEKPGGPEG